MPIVGSIKKVEKWLTENVCPLVKLKMPPEQEEADGGGYAYRLVQPSAFSLFVPTKDRLPPGLPVRIPSVCVRLMEGYDSLIGASRTLRLNLGFSAWDPGLHGRDIWTPDKAEPGRFIHQLNEETEKFYRRHGEGWMDAWNFVDTAIREIENAEYIDGLRIVKEARVDFGPFAEQDAIPDFFPFWFAWVEFSVEEGIARTAREYEQYL